MKWCTARAGWGAGPLAGITVSLVPQPGPPQPPGPGGWELPTPSCFLLQAPLVFRALSFPSRAGCLASEEELMSTLPLHALGDCQHRVMGGQDPAFKAVSRLACPLEPVASGGLVGEWS